MAKKYVLQGLLDLAGNFVVEQKGQWQHAEWEELLKKAGDLGVPINDETKRNLGNILESCKHFYACGEAAAPARKTAAKPKAKPKAK